MNSSNSSEIQLLARAYVRVSTTNQAETGQSIQTQKTRIEDYCKYKRLTLVECYIDAGISGKNTEDRPELQRLLNEAKSGEYVIISDLSRLSRNTLDSLTILENLKKRQINLIMLSPDIDVSTPTGTMVFTMLASVARMERDNISRNVKVNMQRLSKEGKLRSKPPFGYKFVAKDLDFEIVPEQQLVIIKIIQLFRENPSIAPIVRKLNEDGDNKVIGLNRKDKTKEYKFNRNLIQLILVDNDVLMPPAYLGERKSIEQRIESHNK